MLFSSIPNKPLKGPEWIPPALLSPRALSTSLSSPAMWITGLQLFPKCLPLWKAQNSSWKTELSLSAGADLFYPAGKAAFFVVVVLMAEYININPVSEIGLQAKILITTFSMQWWLGPSCYKVYRLPEEVRQGWGNERCKHTEFREKELQYSSKLSGSTPQVGFRWGAICLILRAMIPPYEDIVGLGTKWFICSRVALCETRVSKSIVAFFTIGKLQN